MQRKCHAPRGAKTRRRSCRRVRPFGTFAGGVQSFGAGAGGTFIWPMQDLIAVLHLVAQSQKPDAAMCTEGQMGDK